MFLHQTLHSRPPLLMEAWIDRSVAMLVMHFGPRDPEMHSHDATSYYAAIRPASAATHPYAVRHSFHNDFTPGCVACFARPTPGYRGLLDLAFGSPCLVGRTTAIPILRRAAFLEFTSAWGGSVDGHSMR